MALVGAGKSQVGNNEGRLATFALDVPQILCSAWPGVGGAGAGADVGGAPFRHACTCALDACMRQVSEAAAAAAVPAATAFALVSSASSSSFAVAPGTCAVRFDLQVRGLLLCLCFRGPRVVAAMQARELTLAKSAATGSKAEAEAIALSRACAPL